MAHLSRKTVHDAGISSPINTYEINDQGGDIVFTPKSSFAIVENIPLVFTQDKICRDYQRKLNIGDGDVRPGTTK
jgi:hypothetical protein